MKTAVPVSVLVFVHVLAASSVATDGSERRSSLPESARVGAEASRVVFSLQTGSCWGQSTEKRVVEIRPTGVAVRSADGRKVIAERSRAWWERTRKLLNRGLAASSPKPEHGDCYLPNWICGFEIETTVGKQKKIISGCCNTSKDASLVRDAFRRIKPGGPLGPDRPPVP